MAAICLIDACLAVWLSVSIVRCRDYTLVLGMPGTGKTSTIVAAVAALVASHCSVLITSYTNSAVDNVLLKLAEAGVGFVRLGRPESCHAGVRDRVPGGERFPDTSVAGLRRLAAREPVVRVHMLCGASCAFRSCRPSFTFGPCRCFSHVDLSVCLSICNSSFHVLRLSPWNGKGKACVASCGWQCLNGMWMHACVLCPMSA
jgi:AAA domain